MSKRISQASIDRGDFDDAFPPKPIPVETLDGVRLVFPSDAEHAFAVAAEKNGWQLSKRGWPDFLCFKGDRIIAVEVKQSKGDKLKPQQVRVMKVLVKHGIECYRWTPDLGFERITLDGFVSKSTTYR